MATDQFCLRWNNFQVNITSALESLKCDEDLVDVTLTCDGQNVKAHKVILSACSPYFRNLFRENPCQHPVVILKDVSYDDVTALLNFMYQGEVYITQDRLAPFLHTAELLQVRGLAGASNPFKESQPPSQPPTTPQPKHLQQPKLKKATPLSAGQLRRGTPPLSISSTISHQTSSKPLPYTPYRTAKSPLVSPSSKDVHPAIQLKEKSVAPSHSFSVQSRESDPKSSLSQSNVSPASLSAFPSNNEQSSTSSYSVLPEQQPYTSSQLHSTTYQSQHTSEHSSTFPPIPPDERSSSQPSSPQPTSAKRRKAFPRRLSSSSSGHIPAGDDAEHLKEGSSEEYEVVKVVPPIVKQEPVDSEVEGDGQDDVDTASRQSADSEDMEVTGFYSQPNVDTEDPISLEQNIVKEEATTEGASEVSPHSMLLRSLAGVHVQQSDDADYSNQAASSTETFLMPAWDLNSSNSDTFPSSTNWSSPKRRVRLSSKSFTVVDGRPFLTPEGLQVVQLKNDGISVPGGQIQIPVVEANVGEYYASGSYSSVAARLASRNLYQKRKHVWRSRRPVQCPNCQKVITMAYNLKSHLSTCLKRNGGLYRKT